MEVTTELIKTLRERTGAGILDCKEALQREDGDLDKAEKALKEAGYADAQKRANRDTREGVIGSYIHSGNKIGAIIEVNCETDFVARTTEMQSLAHDLAMQVAAMSPQYIGGKDIEELDPKPSPDICLLQQAYIKDTNLKVQDIIQDIISKVGENIRVNRFSRFALGE